MDFVQVMSRGIKAAGDNNGSHSECFLVLRMTCCPAPCKLINDRAAWRSGAAQHNEYRKRPHVSVLVWKVIYGSFELFILPFGGL